jgi:ethanolamine permease
MHLKRQLNSTQLWAITVGMVISGQFFGWNYGFASGLHALIIATIVVSIFYTSFMLTYTQLAVKMPSAGGPMLYAQKAVGNGFAFAIGMACLFEFLFAIPAIAIATGGYIHFLYATINPHAAAIFVLILFSIINIWPLKNSAKIELVATSLALVGLVLFYCTGLTASVQHTTATSTNNIGFMHAIPFAIWLYLAIEGGALTAEEVKSPNKNLPRAFVIAIFTILTCSLLTLATVAHLKSSAAISDYPISAAIAGHAAPAISYTITILSLFALIASLNGIMIAATRQLFSLSRAGFISQSFSKITNGTPLVSLIFVTGFSFICIYLANIAKMLIELSVLAAMLMYLGALISWFILDRRGEFKSCSYQVPLRILPYTAVAGCLLCLYALVRYCVLGVSLQFMTYHMPLLDIILAIIILSAGYYLLKNRNSRISC